MSDERLNENGHDNVDNSTVEDSPDALKELQQVRTERDQYQQAAVIAESNELTLHRKLSSYMETELDELRQEVQSWRERDLVMRETSAVSAQESRAGKEVMDDRS